MLRATTALMNRELRADMRSLWRHLFRLALVAGLYAIICYRATTLATAPGLLLFEGMSLVTYCAISFAGISFLATAVAEEKEQQSLGLLQLAGANSLAILAGKIVPRITFVLLLITASLPFTLLAITLGGVTLHQIAAMYIAFLAYGTLLGGVGALAAVLTSSEAMAALLTLLLGACLSLTGFLFEISEDTAPFGDLQKKMPLVKDLDHLIEFSILDRLMTVPQTGFFEPLVSGQVIWDCSFGVACFALACVLLPRYADRPATTRRLFRARQGILRPFGPRRAWPGGLVWKDFYFVGGGIPAALIWGLLPPVLVIALVASGEFSLRDAPLYGTAFTLGVALAFLSVQVFWS